jgi:hypothetical protein
VDNVSTWLEMYPRDLCNGWLSKVGCPNPQSQGATKDLSKQSDTTISSALESKKLLLPVVNVSP